MKSEEYLIDSESFAKIDDKKGAKVNIKTERRAIIKKFKKNEIFTPFFIRANSPAP